MKHSVRVFLYLAMLVLLIVTASVVIAQDDPNIGVYAHPVSFPDLDPSSSFSNENVVMGNVYETLTFYNPPGSEQEISPRLAVSWEADEYAMQWTFNLRQGVKFHDGTDFNADAVKFSLERTVSLGLGAAYIFDPIETITVIDDYTIQFDLKYSAPLDLILATGYAAWIMSPTAVADKDATWFNAGNSAGTGPYMITQYEPGALLVADAFPEYWGGWSEGQFDKIVFQIVEDPTVLEQLIRSGDADFTYSLPFDNYASLQEVPELRVDIQPAFQNLLGLLNTRREPTNNPLVRQALAYSFPYQVVVDNLYAGYGSQSRGPIPAGMWGTSDAVPQMTQDLDRAKELLAEAGYPDGGIDLLYTYVAGDLDEQQIGELWAADLATIGVNLEVQGLEWEAQWDLGKNDPENAQHIFAFYWWPDYVTPFSFLYSMFHSEDQPFFNLGYYSNITFDTLIDEGNVLSGTDRAAATELFVQAQQILVEDAAALFIVDLPNIHVIRSDINGYVDNPAYPHVVFWYNLSR